MCVRVYLFYVYVHVCTHVCRVYLYICVHVCESQRLMSDILSHASRAGSLMELGSLHLFPSSQPWGYRHMPPHLALSVGTSKRSSGPPTCEARTFLTEPYPHLRVLSGQCRTCGVYIQFLSTQCLQMFVTQHSEILRLSFWFVCLRLFIPCCLRSQRGRWIQDWKEEGVKKNSGIL